MRTVLLTLVVSLGIGIFFFVQKPDYSGTEIWSPSQDDTLQVQFQGNFVRGDFDSTVDADIYDLDLFDTPKGTIEALRADGKRVICYISAGSWENWRPDKDAFPQEVIGKEYRGWWGENWLDIRRIDLLAPIIGARFDLAKEKGCDGIDTDNVDGYKTDTGFPLTYADQLAYNTWLAEEAHKRGLSIGLKNDPEQAQDLATIFDWAIIESCHKEGWCGMMSPFVTLGKLVFQIEYATSSLRLDEICPAAKNLGFKAFLKREFLDSWMVRC